MRKSNENNSMALGVSLFKESGGKQILQELAQEMSQLYGLAKSALNEISEQASGMRFNPGAGA